MKLKLTLACAFAVLVASVAPLRSVAHAGGAATLDPCAAPLPVELAFSGGPSLAVTRLYGAGASMSVVQFAGGLNKEVQRIHLLDGGPPLVRHDQVAEFTLFLPGRTHIYGGPVHVFRHGGYQHICRSGGVMVDAHGNTTQQANPYRVQIHFDGWIRGTRAWGSVWVGHAYYRLAGTTSTPS